MKEFLQNLINDKKKMTIAGVVIVICIFVIFAISDHKKSTNNDVIAPDGSVDGSSSGAVYDDTYVEPVIEDDVVSEKSSSSKLDYSKIITTLNKAASEGWYGFDPSDILVSHRVVYNNSGYAEKDLDNDGYVELIIGSVDTNEIYTIYTLNRKGIANVVCSARTDDMYYHIAGNVIVDSFGNTQEFVDKVLTSYDKYANPVGEFDIIEFTPFEYSSFEGLPALSSSDWSLDQTSNQITFALSAVIREENVDLYRRNGVVAIDTLGRPIWYYGSDYINCSYIESYDTMLDGVCIYNNDSLVGFISIYEVNDFEALSSAIRDKGLLYKDVLDDYYEAISDDGNCKFIVDSSHLYVVSTVDGFDCINFMFK